jgi:hypothetical protein
MKTRAIVLTVVVCLIGRLSRELRCWELDELLGD